MSSPDHTLEPIFAALDQAAAREAEHLAVMERAADACSRADQRLAALEELIAGYRRHVGSLVVLIRERQRRDPPDSRGQPHPLSLANQRAAEGNAIFNAHRHDAYALRVVTEGEACPDAPCPEDLPALAAIAADLMRGGRCHG